MSSGHFGRLRSSRGRWRGARLCRYSFPMSSTTYSVDALTRFATGLLTAAGLSTDKAEAVAAILVDGDLMGHDTHGLALLGALPGGAGIRLHDARGRSHRAGRCAGRRDLGRTPPAGAVAGAAGDGTRHRTRGALRHRHGRHPAQPSHRLPGGLPQARHRAGTDDAAELLRRQLGQRGAGRRARSGVHAEPDRGRHSHGGNAGADRHLDVGHDQWPHQPAAPGRQAAARALGHRRQWPADRRSLGALRGTQGHDPAAGRHRLGPQGLRPVAPGGGSDGRTRGARPRRSARGLGRHGVPPGDRSARVRRARRLHAPDRRGGAPVPRLASRASRCAGANARRKGPGAGATTARGRGDALSRHHADAGTLGRAGWGSRCRRPGPEARRLRSRSGATAAPARRAPGPGRTTPAG